LCRWLSPNNCSITEVSFSGTRITCDNLANLLQSNKRINKLKIDFCRSYLGFPIYFEQEIDRIIKLLSNASHLKKLKVSNVWTWSSRQEQDTTLDALISLLGNNSLSSLTYSARGNSSMFEVPPETLLARVEALQQALEQTTQLTYLRIRPHPPYKHAPWYYALVKRILRRNYCNKVRAALCSLPTWPRPQALFGKMLTRTNKRRSRLDPMGSTNETFHLLLQCSEMLKQTWDDRRAELHDQKRQKK